MNWPKRKLLFREIFLFMVFTAIVGCGVKGDPLPPEKPVELGRGRPTYKRATEGLKIETTKPPPASKRQYDEDEDEDEDEE